MRCLMIPKPPIFKVPYYVLMICSFLVLLMIPLRLQAEEPRATLRVTRPNQFSGSGSPLYVHVNGQLAGTVDGDNSFSSKPPQSQAFSYIPNKDGKNVVDLK